MSGSNIKQAVPFFMVKDIQLSMQFYVNHLGCTMTHSWIDEGKLKWCWLRMDEAAIMLQELNEKNDLRNKKLGDGVEICFVCEDAIAFYKEIASKGITADEPFVGNNMWVVSLRDPDGYRISFESMTDVPEETKYFEWKENNDQVK